MTTPSTQFLTGQQSVNSVAAPLNNGVATSFASGIKLTCLATSAYPLFIGDSSVTLSTGDELAPGSSVILPIYDVSTIYVISQGATISWLGIY